MAYEVRQVNLIRSSILTGLASPIGLIICFYHLEELPQSNLPEINWQNKLFALNAYMCVISAGLFVLSLYLRKKKRYQGLFTRILPHVVFFVTAGWGTMTAIYDQAISTSIIAFLLVCLLNAMSLLIRPLNHFIYLAIIYGFFYYGLSISGIHPSVALFNSINGFCVVVIAFALGYIFWNNNMTRFKQSRLIKSQQIQLEHQYEKLVKSSRELEKSNSSKDKFFSILAHDLRGPITSTLALTELLEEGMFEEDKNERQRMYKLLQNSLDNSSKLLENVLLWSRNQAGILSFKPIVMDVRRTVQANIDMLRIVAAHKDIQVHNLVQRDLEMYADADMINTIFRNLLSNAIKFTPQDGRVEIYAEACLYPNENKPAVRVIVADYGIGMPVEVLDNLFHIDQKMIGLGTNNETGTGLGLVLCKDFIEKHSGNIHVESTPGEGSKFIITLPNQN